MKAVFFLLLINIGFIQCSNYEYSPNEVFDRQTIKNSNAKNLQKLGIGENDDTIKFALTADTHLAHDEVVKFYKNLNKRPDIDFVIVAGDLSEFGTLKEMEWISKNFKHLNIPYMAVIGNHDLTSKGGQVFQYMFGEFNYSFVYGGVKFICHDTNSREYNFNGQVPDIAWLKKELQATPSVKGYVAISHVPPDSDDFDQILFEEYTAAFAQAPGFLASFHAHYHRYEELDIDHSGIPYIVTNTILNNEFLLVTIIHNQISFERVYL